MTSLVATCPATLDGTEPRDLDSWFAFCTEFKVVRRNGFCALLGPAPTSTMSTR